MPRIISPFRGADPLAQTIASLGKSLFGGDAAGGAIKREQLRALERGNVETEALMGSVAASGVQNLGNDPLTQAMIIGSGYKPEDFAAIGRMGAATQHGATSPQTDNWRAAAGAPASALQSNFDATLGENRRQFDMKPLEALGMDGMPVWATQGNTTGTQPILSDADRKGTMVGQFAAQPGGLGAAPPAERQYMGATAGDGAGRAPFNYRAPDGSIHMSTDGVSDVHGVPLPPGGARMGVEDTVEGGLTNSTQSGLQQDNLALQRFSALADLADGGTDPTKGLLSDPTRFGITGTVRDYGQDIMQIVGNASQIFGGSTPDEAINNVRVEAMNSGIAPDLLPELYDPSLPQVDTVWGLLVYQGAAAFAGQSGRSVSDKDVHFFKQILGEPKSFFASAESMKAHLKTARQLATGYQAINNATLTGQNAPPPPPLATEPVAPQGQTPTIATPEEYNALPSGTEFVAPDGSRRRKP